MILLKHPGKTIGILNPTTLQISPVGQASLLRYPMARSMRNRLRKKENDDENWF